MATSYLPDVFTAAGPTHYHQHDHSLSAIIEAQVQEAYASLDDFVASECLIADIARYLLRAIRLLSDLAHGMAHGEHVDLYLSRKVRQMEAFDGFNDLLMLDGLSQKEKFLKFAFILSSSTSICLPKDWYIQQKVYRIPYTPPREGYQERIRYPSRPIHSFRKLQRSINGGSYHHGSRYKWHFFKLRLAASGSSSHCFFPDSRARWTKWHRGPSRGNFKVPFDSRKRSILLPIRDTL